jgi:hypothetical protein
MSSYESKQEEGVHMKSIVAIVLGFLLTAAAFGQDPSQDAKEKAKQTAEAWLVLLDEGKFADSWEASASLAKNAVSKEQWVQSIKSARSMFGGVEKRTIKSTEYATSLPGAPDGHYVIIQYETAFEKKQSAVETVTPMKDSDGQWRVSGYFIK